MSYATLALVLASLVLGAPGASAAARSDLERSSVRLFEEYVRAENAGDFDRLASFFDEGYQAEYNGSEIPGRGPQVEVERVRPFRAALPDYVGEVEQVVAEGDLIAAGWRIRGTYEGKDFGVAPSHRSVEIAGCTLFQVRDSRFVRGFSYLDRGTLLEQLGVRRQLSITLVAMGGVVGALIALIAVAVRTRVLAAREGRLVRVGLSSAVIIAAVGVFALLAAGLLEWLGRSAPI